jgi:endonuclease/exonuclease/phosphatase family metal-dependent hydrolase
VTRAQEARRWPLPGLWLALALVLQAPAAVAQVVFNAATYNLRLDTPRDGADAWPLRKEAVKALVRWHEFDLVGTQEGFVEQVEELAAMPGFAYVGVGRDDGRRAGEHAAILYRTARFELLDKGDFWLSPTPDKPGKGWDATCCNRIASWARLRERASGKAFFVFSVHFDHEGVQARRESAHLMLRKMREIAGDAPALCLGDFNATPDSEPIRIMAAGLRDARRVSAAPPYGPVGTFNGFKLDAPLQERIDYVFLTPHWRVLRYAALTDTYQARYPSDHLPVVVRVALD